MTYEELKVEAKRQGTKEKNHENTRKSSKIHTHQKPYP